MRTHVFQIMPLGQDDLGAMILSTYCGCGLWAMSMKHTQTFISSSLFAEAQYQWEQHFQDALKADGEAVAVPGMVPVEVDDEPDHV